MADNTYYGAGTYNEGVYQPYQVAPDSLSDAEATDPPALTSTGTVYPDPATDAETVTAPDTTTATAPAAPNSATDTETLDPPTTATSTTAAPASGTDGEALDGPSLAQTGTAAPTSITDAETLDGPTLTAAGTAVPDSLIDTETLDGPTATAVGAAAAPQGITDPDTLADTIATSTASIANVDGSGDGETLDGPTLTIQTDTTPADLVDAETFGNPSASFTTAPATPDSITDMETIQGGGVGGENVTYGTGTYGQGVYFGYNIADDQTATTWDLSDGETIGEPALSFVQLANPNFTYGRGEYGAGIYYGEVIPDGDGGAQPLYPPQPYTYRTPPQHIIGAGPWSPLVIWGAPNYGARRTRRAARPVVGLPRATSQSFTLRLNEGSEVQLSYLFTRDQVFIPEKLHTDLWWRRREPSTGAIEPIGRYNVSSTDVSLRDDGVSVNVTGVDYRTLLGDRMVLKYNDTEHSENQWGKGTKLVTIMRFAVPTNMGLDLSVLDDDDPAGLGVTTRPFEIELGSTVAEVFANLLTISEDEWEWWVEMPAALDAAPKLAFAGQRGRNQGVVLADTGGPTPIASWQQVASTDQYANSLYFVGKDGGDVAQLADDIAYYGQRDASDSDSSVTGKVDSTGKPYLLDRAARRRLAELSDLRPTYTITLAPGWWRGRDHLDIGDTVSVFIRLGQDLLTGTYRVTELSCQMDENGGETITLTLGRPLASANPRSRRSALARIVARLKNYERRES